MGIMITSLSPPPLNDDHKYARSLPSPPARPSGPLSAVNRNRRKESEGGKVGPVVPGVKYDGDPSLQLKQQSDGLSNKAAACCQTGAISVNRSRFPKHAPRHDPSGVLASDIFYILKACSTRMPGTGFLGPAASAGPEKGAVK